MKFHESALQIECVKWFRYQYPHTLIFSIPNARKVGKRIGGILKAEGLTAGVADLCLLKQSKGYGALFIEMKTEKTSQSDPQKAFQKYCDDNGYLYKVCRNFDEFKLTVENYI